MAFPFGGGLSLIKPRSGNSIRAGGVGTPIYVNTPQVEPSGVARFRTQPDGAPVVPGNISPSFSFDATIASSIASQLSLSRTSGATYYDSTGTIQTASSGVARFDNIFNGTAWVQAGLLLEEQRTNLVINTDISSAAWTPGHTTLSTDGTLDPRGSLAQLLTFDAFTVAHAIFTSTPPTITAGSTYTLSIYAKAGTTGSFIFLNFQDGGTSTNNAGAVFNLTGTGTATATETHTGGNGAISRTFQRYVGNGWYRLETTVSLATATSAYFQPGVAASATGNTWGSGGDIATTGGSGNNFYLALPQLEQAGFASSLIITSGAAATRSADIISSTDVTLLAAMAWVVETGELQAATASTLLGINTAVGIGEDTSNQLTTADGGTQTSKNREDWTQPTRGGIAWDATPRVSISLDGWVVATAGNTPVTPTSLYFGNTNNGASGFLNGHIRMMAAYAAADDTQLQALTPVGASFTIGAGINAALAATEAPDVAAFAATETINAALAATEAQDVAAFVASPVINAALAATEAPDTAAIAVQVKINAALSVTEAQDVAAFVVIEIDTAVLAATEAQDVAALAVTLTDNAALAATETKDVAAFVATIGDNAALAATEAQDVAAFVAIETDTAVLAATEAPDTATFSVQVKINAALGATEAPDVALINASGSIVAALTVTEAPDLAAFAASTIDVAFLAATELPDTAAFSVSIIPSTVCFLSLAATEAPDIASVLAYTTAFSLPTSRFIWPRAGDRYESLTVTTMKKAFSARNWDDFMSLANVRGIDVFGYNGLLSQAYEDAVPLINPATSRQAVKFFLSNGQQFVIDVPDDMTGIYRDVLRRMSA